MKLSCLSFPQVAAAVTILCAVNWAVLQFFFLPSLSEEQRRHIYPAWVHSPYIYAMCFAFTACAFWFVFRYRGNPATYEKRITLFGMGLATMGGLFMLTVLRATWHI